MFWEMNQPGATKLLLVSRHSDALAAFGATGAEDVATARGFHASAEAMGSQTTGVVRLKSTFHGTLDFLL